jgi:internalin A
VGTRAPTALWVITLAFAVGSARAEYPVHFGDANLKAAVEVALGVSDPTPTDMLSLTQLGVSGKGIQSLTGLEDATNLDTLNTRGNSISDISALAGMANLGKLNLEQNQISDISPLSALTCLWYVNLLNNPGQQVWPLGGNSL